MMNICRTNDSLDNDCQKTDYFQVAWLLWEKLNDLVDGDKREFPELGLQSLLNMAVVHNIVSVDPKMLNPILWRNLSKDLLLLVLAYCGDVGHLLVKSKHLYIFYISYIIVD